MQRAQNTKKKKKKKKPQKKTIFLYTNFEDIKTKIRITIQLKTIPQIVKDNNKACRGLAWKSYKK